MKAITLTDIMTILLGFLDLILSIDREILVMLISWPVLTKVFEHVL